MLTPALDLFMSLHETSPALAWSAGAIALTIVGAILAKAIEFLTALLTSLGSFLCARLIETYTTVYTLEFGQLSDFERWINEHPDAVIWRNFSLTKEGRGAKALKFGPNTKILFRFKNRLFWFTLGSDGDADGGGNKLEDASRHSNSYGNGGFIEATITTAFAPMGLFTEFLNGLTTTKSVLERDCVSVLVPDGMHWNSFSVPPRPLESVVLDEKVKSTMVRTIDNFFLSAFKYQELAIPHRLGVMLEGPPGNGKTSLVQSLAHHYGANLCVINLGSGATTDDTLANLIRTGIHFSIHYADLSDEEEYASYTEADRRLMQKGLILGPQGHLTMRPTFILFEDLSAVGFGVQKKSSKNRRMAAVGESDTLTLSGFLNAIDGAYTPHDIVFFFTANEPDNLDPAIMRHGRVDLRVRLENATTAQAKQLFLRFYPTEASLAEEFASLIPAGEWNMASIQFCLATNLNNPRGAVEWARQRRESNS